MQNAVINVVTDCKEKLDKSDDYKFIISGSLLIYIIATFSGGSRNNDDYYYENMMLFQIDSMIY